MRLHARKTSSKRESRIVDRGLGRGKRAFRLRCCSRGTSIVLMDLIGYVQTSADRFESRECCSSARSSWMETPPRGETGSRPCTRGITSSLPINCDRVTFYRYFLDLDPGLPSTAACRLTSRRRDRFQSRAAINLQTFGPLGRRLEFFERRSSTRSDTR